MVSGNVTMSHTNNAGSAVKGKIRCEGTENRRLTMVNLNV
jgi:hypothetical protein